MKHVTVACLLLSTSALAQRALPFAWSTATLTRGTHELQTWVTPGSGRADTKYLRFDLRFALSQGVTDKVDTLFGLDLGLESFGVDARTIDARAASTWRFSFTKATDAVGVAALAHVGLGFDALDLEARLIVDKRIGALLLTFNASATRTAFWSGRSGYDTHFEELVSVAYFVSDAFCAGLEGRVRHSLREGAFGGTAYTVGPSFSYQGKRWWLSVGGLAQVAADKPLADRRNGEPLEIRDNERFVARLVLGVKTDAD